MKEFSARTAEGFLNRCGWCPTQRRGEWRFTNAKFGGWTHHRHGGKRFWCMKSSKSCSAWFGESFIFAVQDISQLNSDIVDTEVSNDILMNLQTNYTQLQETNLCKSKPWLWSSSTLKKKHALTLDIYSRCSCFNWKSRNFAGINSAGLSSSSTTCLSEISAPADWSKWLSQVHPSEKTKRHRRHISVFFDLTTGAPWDGQIGATFWMNEIVAKCEISNLQKWPMHSPHSFERCDTLLRLYN